MLRKTLMAPLAPLLLVATMSGCSHGNLEDQKFVSVQGAAQWITNNECDSQGAQQGYPGYDNDGIGHLDYMCDNGKKFSIDHYKDGYFRAKSVTN